MDTATTTSSINSMPNSATNADDNNNNDNVVGRNSLDALVAISDLVDQHMFYNSSSSSRLTVAANDVIGLEKSFFATNGTNIHYRQQRISAVKVTPASVERYDNVVVGLSSGKGVNVKNTKIELPAGLNYVFDTQNKHRHHDFR